MKPATTIAIVAGFSRNASAASPPANESNSKAEGRLSPLPDSFSRSRLMPVLAALCSRECSGKAVSLRFWASNLSFLPSGNCCQSAAGGFSGMMMSRCSVVLSDTSVTFPGVCRTRSSGWLGRRLIFAADIGFALQDFLNSYKDYENLRAAIVTERCRSTSSCARKRRRRK